MHMKRLVPILGSLHDLSLEFDLPVEAAHVELGLCLPQRGPSCLVGGGQRQSVIRLRRIINFLQHPLILK